MEDGKVNKIKTYNYLGDIMLKYKLYVFLLFIIGILSIPMINNKKTYNLYLSIISPK